MSQPRLLLVEDDQALAELVEFRFKAEGYAVTRTDDGDEALLLAAEEVPDVVILDWMIEGTSGIEVCRRLRRDKQTAHVPIVMLTAREAEDDRVRGLETGADDYVTKPFSPRELVARVNAIMRRIRPALAGEMLSVGDLTLDATAHRVTRRGTTIALGPTEFRLLRHFMEHPGRVFSRNQLLDAVWGTGSDIELRTVDVHIRRLRKGIELPGVPDPVRTVRSAGYSLEAV
jgi:two-component system phosphate regulon response regulator PhoB